MLGVYLSLFGAAFLPFTKPLVAALTTLFIVASYCWMRRRIRAVGSAANIGKAAFPCERDQTGPLDASQAGPN